MMKRKNKRISQSFLRWLLVLVSVAFLATTVFLWIIQTRLSEENAISLLALNLSDVREDVSDASDENLLKLTHRVADDLNRMKTIDNAVLQELVNRYDITEINVINEEGIIFATTHPDFMGYDMRNGEQSAEFIGLFYGSTEYVQDYRPTTYDPSLFRKYAGVRLQRGGFVQVGYGAERFQQDIDEFVVGVTRNRHVGSGGCIIIVDEEWNIVSDRMGNEGKNLDVTGLWLDTSSMSENQVFVADVYDQSC